LTTTVSLDGPVAVAVAVVVVVVFVPVVVVLVPVVVVLVPVVVVLVGGMSQIVPLGSFTQVLVLRLQQVTPGQSLSVAQ